jgi:hypothetical protein
MPLLVRRCLNSWISKNPTWEFRLIDNRNVRQYVELPDLHTRTITLASLSDILRISLLHEYGGVWVDATLFCNKKLDEWMDNVFGEDFFAFANPSPDRMISSWFLASHENALITKKWFAATQNYWLNHRCSADYFWFHHLFGKLYAKDVEFAGAWDKVIKISADGPHSIQQAGLFTKDKSKADWQSPVFKLTYRYDDRLYKPGTLVFYLLEKERQQPRAQLFFQHKLPDYLSKKISLLRKTFKQSIHKKPNAIASLKTKTENLGDHIQIIAGLKLLNCIDAKPALYVDRDDEIKTAPGLKEISGKVPILLNGWFKTNPKEWPPNKKFAALYYSYHIRLFQCPELISRRAIAHYKKWEPVGCRDSYTCELLRKHGVDAFVSHCLTLTFPKRKIDPVKQNKVLVISRDRRILDFLPNIPGNIEFISHYTGSCDFDSNMVEANSVLQYYGENASLVITTLLHAATLALAMGIPLIVFYPLNNEKGHASDVERFSSVAEFIEIHTPGKHEGIDWNGKVLNLGQLKFRMREKFFEMAKRWNLPSSGIVGPIAPGGELPPPATLK